MPASIAKRAVATAGVGYLCYVHIPLLRWVGPKTARRVADMTAWVHWLAMRCGLGRGVWRTIAAAAPQTASDEGVSQLVRRHLRMKHRNLADWNLYITPRGRVAFDQQPGEVIGRERLDAAIAEGRGAILLFYHFGAAKMIAPFLNARGYEVAIHRHVAPTYAGKTVDAMARAAQQRAQADEERSGLKTFFHKPDVSLTILWRYLRRGGVLGMNGDGMTGDDFVAAPFLGGEMSFPSGPAQLAAQSGAPLLPTYLVEDADGHRTMTIGDPITVADASPETVEAAIRRCVQTLEERTREQPWAWWTWRRLRVQRSADNRAVFAAEYLSADGSAVPIAARSA